MAVPSDTPATRTVKPVERPNAPRDDPNANPAMLKADINSGATGDKVQAFDPGLSMLGTDDEAAGRPASSARVNLAREQETKQSPQPDANQVAAAHGRPGMALYGFIGLIVLVGAIFAAVLLLR